MPRYIQCTSCATPVLRGYAFVGKNKSGPLCATCADGVSKVPMAAPIRPAPKMAFAIQEPSRKSWPESPKVIRDRRTGGATNWIKGTTDGHAWEAQVFDEGSDHGINGGRVSRLLITKKGEWPQGLNNAIYNYDRGVDINDAPAGLVRKIIGQWPG